MAAAWLGLSGAPLADTGVENGETAAEDSEAGININLDAELASAYGFRGLNLFGDEQIDQHVSMFPSATVSKGPVSGGYWGAYQLTGDNAGRKIDEGYGAETDLWVSYQGSAGKFGYSATLTYFVFPFADEATAGTAIPMYLEPGVGLSYSTAVDLGLTISYFRGLQDATKNLSYVYINRSVTKEISLTSDINLNLGGTFGHKIWTNNPETLNNTYHVQLDAGVTIPFGSAYYVTPAAHFVWTNLAERGFGRELAVWAGVHLGYDFKI